MDEENNVSGDQSLEAAAPTSNESEHAYTEQVGESTTQQEQTVPLTALQSERASRQEMQDELRMIKDHLSLLQSNQSQTQSTKKDEFDNMDDGDVLTVGEAKKFISKLNNQHQMSIEELRMAQKYPDYQQVISKYLPEVIKTNPGLRNSLQKTQDYELAYYLAKNSDSYRDQNKRSKKSADAQRIVENSQKMGTLSSVGSSSPISLAKRYKDMSDSDFKNLVSKNLGEL